MLDCRIRTIIYSFVALFVFGFIIFKFCQDVSNSLRSDIHKTYEKLYKPSKESDNEEREDLLKCAESNTKWAYFSVTLTLIASVAFLIRLYFSMELFDGHELYYHRYIRPLRYLRVPEWLLRLVIVAYLILGTEFGFVYCSPLRNRPKYGNIS
jgi:hypothetical protein